MVKKGDTLIEVLLAVGIFSMIAISVVAVMSGGTSSAQTALETTLAREEIDAQAEALRYIHDSYINDKESANSELPTIALWQKIIDEKNVYLPSGDSKDADVLQYHPTTCPTKASELPKGAFILDTRSLSQPNAAAYKSADTDKDIFAPASTFPRLIFGTDEDKSLIEGDVSTTLSRAEGIYIIAVADKDTTTIISDSGQKYHAFYDFYIRTCWYGTDAETPSTISTVMRLHNPEAAVIDEQQYGLTFTFDGNGNNGGGSIQPIYNLSEGTFTFPENEFSWADSDYYNNKIRFAGWSFNKNAKAGSSEVYKPGQQYQIGKLTRDETKTLYAIWEVTDPNAIYWLDVNVFVNARGTSTGGYGKDGFHVKVYVNNQEDPYPTDPTGGDYYKQLPIGSEVKIVFNKVNGYYISNFDTICYDKQNPPKPMKGCTAGQTNTDYYVTLRVYPEYVNAQLDSSQHHAIQIEPLWLKKS